MLADTLIQNHSVCEKIQRKQLMTLPSANLHQTTRAPKNSTPWHQGPLGARSTTLNHGSHNNTHLEAVGILRSSSHRLLPCLGLLVTRMKAEGLLHHPAAMYKLANARIGKHEPASFVQKQVLRESLSHQNINLNALSMRHEHTKSSPGKPKPPYSSCFNKPLAQLAESSESCQHSPTPPAPPCVTPG